MFLFLPGLAFGLGCFGGGLILLQPFQRFGQFKGQPYNCKPHQFQFLEFFFTPAADAADGVDLDAFGQYEAVHVNYPAAQAVPMVILQLADDLFDGQSKSLFQTQLIGLEIRSVPIVVFSPLGDAV